MSKRMARGDWGKLFVDGKEVRNVADIQSAAPSPDLRKLIEQRDELLEALKKLTASHASFFGIEAALQEARAAIKKAEEGA